MNVNVINQMLVHLNWKYMYRYVRMFMCDMVLLGMIGQIVALRVCVSMSVSVCLSVCVY